MLASVIIPTYKRDFDLVRSIQSILSEDEVFELIVVDQTPEHDQNTSEFLASVTDPRFQYFRVAPPSLTAARNFGIEKATGDVVIFVDDDVECLAGFVEGHRVAYEDPTIGAVSGRIIAKSEPPGSVLSYLAWDGFRKGTFDYNYDADGTLLRGCNMSFRRDVLRAIGGFEGRFVGNASREDFDAAYAARKKGWRVVHRSRPCLVHYDAEFGGSRESAVESRYDILFYQNVFLFLFKHHLYSMLLAQMAVHAGSSAYRRDARHLRAVVTGLRSAYRVWTRGTPIVSVRIA